MAIIPKLAGLAGIAILALASPSSAQEWPSRPIRVLIPFTAGGTADTLGRIAGQKLSESLHQQFIMENRPGGGGLTAAEITAHQPPDGYNLVVSGIGGFIIISATTPNPPVDIIKDFTHIAILGGPPSVLVDSGATADIIGCPRCANIGLNFSDDAYLGRRAILRPRGRNRRTFRQTGSACGSSR